MKRPLTRWLVYTAISIALLVAIQFLTGLIPGTAISKQLVTGSCVNLLLAICAIEFGLGVSATAAVLSPLFAFLLGINQILPVVPAIAAGNLIFVVVIYLITRNWNKKFEKKKLLGAYIAVVAAALCKFGVLYLLVVKWIAPVYLAAKLSKLAAMFGVMQLITALIGGIVAASISPAVSKALKSNK